MNLNKFYHFGYATIEYGGHLFHVGQTGFSNKRVDPGSHESTYTLTCVGAIDTMEERVAIVDSYHGAKSTIKTAIRIWQSGKFNIDLLDFLAKTFGTHIRCKRETAG